MPTKEAIQGKRTRDVGQKPEVEALLHIVNDGLHVFPHAYVPKRRTPDGIASRELVLDMPLLFDAESHDLHAEVRSAAAAIAGEFVILAARNLPLGTFGNSQHLHIPNEHLLYETRASSIDGKTVLDQRSIDGRTQYRRNPENAVRLAARTAVWTVRDAAEQLASTGAYIRLQRCHQCPRIFFQGNMNRTHCDVCRKKSPSKGQVAK